jgi:hypothetical protein
MVVDPNEIRFIDYNWENIDEETSKSGRLACASPPFLVHNGLRVDSALSSPRPLNSV